MAQKFSTSRPATSTSETGDRGCRAPVREPGRLDLVELGLQLVLHRSVHVLAPSYSPCSRVPQLGPVEDDLSHAARCGRVECGPP